MNIGIDIDDTMTNTSEIIIAYGQKYDIEVLKRDGSLKNDSGNDFIVCNDIDELISKYGLNNI